MKKRKQNSDQIWFDLYCKVETMLSEQVDSKIIDYIDSTLWKETDVHILPIIESHLRRLTVEET